MKKGKTKHFLEIFFQSEENCGMPVVFTLASDLAEKLNIQVENRQTRQREALEKQLQEEQEAELKRFEGTRVTVETFIKWKVKFDTEMAEIGKFTKIDENEPKKLTGRQMFEKDRSLYDSDIKFVSGEGQFFFVHFRGAVELDSNVKYIGFPILEGFQFRRDPRNRTCFLDRSLERKKIGFSGYSLSKFCID